MIKYKTSTGETVSQATINKRRAEAYRAAEYNEYFGVRSCAGCGGEAQGHAHTVAQARCKILHKTDWIWAEWNFWPACHDCNSAFEAFKGDKCKKLRNYDQLLEVLHERDYPGWLKHQHLT